ncbi:hypothetical protein EMCRGX_G033406 [Ephydatia muelleri]|eukprot:Em0022g817a
MSDEAEDPLQRAVRAKESGNAHFKAKRYDEAIKNYTEAIEVCPPGSKEAAVFYSNRAACWLKLDKYDNALSDANSSLLVAPNDVKALYRRALAQEGLGNSVGAFRDIKQVLAIEPKNADAIEAAQRLTATIKKQAEKMQSTDGIVAEMFTAVSDPSLPKDKLIQAAKNFAILSRESAGAERIFQARGLPQLVSLLDSDHAEVVHHILETFVGLCSDSPTRAHAVIQVLSLEKVRSLLASPLSSVHTSAVSVLRHALLAVSGAHAQAGKGPEGALVLASGALLTPVVRVLLSSLTSINVSANARDLILETITTTIPNMVDVYTKESAIMSFLQLAASTSSVGSGPPVGENTRVSVSLAISTLHKHMGKGQGKLLEECTWFVLTRLSKEDAESQVSGLTALAAIIEGVTEVGNKVLGEELVLTRALKMAKSEDPSCQIVAAEVLALAASDKDRCQGIMAEGLPALKSLHASNDDRVKVRALVGLCKLGSVGGSNVNARTMADGSTAKLEHICRKFLVGAKKGESIRKWAAEGMAFLTLDAEAKEALIADTPALNTLFSMAVGSDPSLLYGIASIFVNLTNSYDRAEKNPELEALGKFAGENVPQEHELDSEEHVKKRVAALLYAGVVPSLLTLAKSESKRTREQVSRVFLALTAEVIHRGAVIQQGGAKCLIPLALDNTDTGKLVAAQALAKIGITCDPKLAFPGQRALEVVRPLVQLLKAEHGLQQFEGLMALTNLGSMSEDVRRRICKEGALPLIESLMFEEHELIRRAATEAMCNLLSLEEVHKRFYSEEVERVKLWTLFSGESDVALAKAASGGLAQISHDPKICQKIMEVKAAPEILKELVTGDNVDLHFRGLYILANLIGASKEIAAKLLEGEFLEILQAYAIGSFPEQQKECAQRALQKAVEYGLIAPNPDLKKNPE